MNKYRPLIVAAVMWASIGAASEFYPESSIAIVIDDLGNNLALGRRAVELPGPLGFAILPLRPQTVALADYAHRLNREVIAHIPMDNRENKVLGPGALKASMNREIFNQNLMAAIQSVPHLQGVSNHMGSLLTENPEQMDWLMTALSALPLYFIDSRTSRETVAHQTARKHRIGSLERDVFLDNDTRYEAIDYQFNRLLKLARRNGSALAIGHPYPSTLDYLEKALPELESRGIHLVSPSQLLTLQAAQNRTPLDDIAQHADAAGALITLCPLTESTGVIQANCL